VGNREGALEVEKQINEIIAQSNMRLQQQQQQAPGVPGMPRIFQNPNKQVRIPATHTGLIIGRGGEMIKLFERSTGARVAVDQTGVGPERIVNIVGTPEQCDAVEIMVWEKIAEAENRQSRYGGGGGGAKYSSSASSASSYGSQSQGGYAEQYAQMYSQYAAAAAYSQYAYDPNALAAATAAAAGGDATAQAAAAGATADPAAAAATAGGAPGGPGTVSVLNYVMPLGFFPNDFPCRMGLTTATFSMRPTTPAGGTTTPPTRGNPFRPAKGPSKHRSDSLPPPPTKKKIYFFED